MISKEENILLAAEKLFAEKGFDATSTREISAAANVNVSMISYYFGSKEQMLEKLFEYRMKESTDFTKTILHREDLNEWEKLMMVVNSYIGRVERLKDFYRIMQTEQITNKNPQINDFMKVSKLGFLKVYEELLQNGSANGVFTKIPQVEFLHATIIGTVFYAFNGMNLYREFNDKNLSPEEYKKTYFENLRKHIKQLLKDLLGYDEK
ncbi:TetR/AcrR family transcriptional regulator [Chryseobacterium koreense]|uniref:TetR/AcrR family transcriptional regulator n=1 Tax=Chryseobacterium koreense TaxID=232216 RepID=UPI0026E9C13B|nr:TetR/AcrR family transcriptional regulator [Chryseobacterium koreense]